MKLRKRTLNTFISAGLGHHKDTDFPALSLLVDYAAQKPGLDLRDYGGANREGFRAYRGDARRIQKSWERVNKALADLANETASLGTITDLDAFVIEASRRAYSGRLEWKARTKEGREWHGWDYCTGQYWPTEYREAVAVVIEQAAHDIRASRPKEARTVNTIDDLKDLNRRNGGCWFDRSTTAFFGSRIESEIIAGRFFVTSEKKGFNERGRAFTVRSFDDKGSIGTVGGFLAYATRAGAIRAARDAAHDEIMEMNKQTAERRPSA